MAHSIPIEGGRVAGRQGARSVSIRILLATTVVAGLVGAAVAGLIVAFVARSSHFTYVSAADLNVRAARNFNVDAGHVRLIGRDGNFELEHDSSVPASTLRAYDVGTGRRTPVQIGYADGEDVVGLLVAGSAGQKSDLQQWTAGGKVVTAIDAKGGLRLGRVTLTTQVRSGVPYLVARTRAGRVFALPLVALRR